MAQREVTTRVREKSFLFGIGLTVLAICLFTVMDHPTEGRIRLTRPLARRLQRAERVRVDGRRAVPVTNSPRKPATGDSRRG